MNGGEHERLLERDLDPGVDDLVVELDELETETVSVVRRIVIMQSYFYKYLIRQFQLLLAFLHYSLLKRQDVTHQKVTLQIPLFKTTNTLFALHQLVTSQIFYIDLQLVLFYIFYIFI